MSPDVAAQIAEIEADLAEATALAKRRIATLLRTVADGPDAAQHTNADTRPSPDRRDKSRVAEVNRELGRIMILDALATHDGRMNWSDLYKVIETTGFSNRVLGGMKTAKLLDYDEDSGDYYLLPAGTERWEQNRHLLPAPDSVATDNPDLTENPSNSTSEDAQ